MLKPVRIAFLIGLCALLSASPAGARSTFHDLSVESARDSETGKAKLQKVPFYMAGQKHPAVAKDLGIFTANRRTNAFGKSDEAACQIAFLSAVIALQSRAQKMGGTAIVDIKSITKHNDLTSASEYRCAAGDVVANVVLSGRVVKLK
ncbi:MAG: excinuclease ABC subunit A [Deltaproteobacteria bacterium]|nr:excinuclease ABC subunit A [Deltaproteobacteria bacterium]MBW2399533.1 excinuclease ABC subunit A [Deltaproteobacteria bacterium]MBW2665968.1 excinuclease ABC subunit A [Deltaproteobacteria bacterium]